MVRGLYAMQCAKNKVLIKPLALARAGCIRAVQLRHAFDGGIFRVGWVVGVRGV